jgi:alkanesulfonate monooxygenase SsuD/methylene tetrahydromethanopterin reductase-like flavin-dependent oxidoreductase (luciferase family)
MRVADENPVRTPYILGAQSGLFCGLYAFEIGVKKNDDLIAHKSKRRATRPIKSAPHLAEGPFAQLTLTSTSYILRRFCLRCPDWEELSVNVGLSVLFQSPSYASGKDDSTGDLDDYGTYALELEIADRAEPLGFDSIWSVEHHFSGYTMCPDVTQFLAYMAARTTRVMLGSMVVVLPWHNPVRVADSVAMLDNLSGGRFVFGIGRGLGRLEFEGLGVPMEESRQRFVESAETILNGLETGYVEYEGQFIKQPKRYIRPAPTASFRGRTYAAAVSPESLDIMAKLGVGLLIVPQKPWETTVTELETYREKFRAINNQEPPTPVVCCLVFVDEDEARSNELGESYIGDYYGSVIKHYELAGQHFAETKGYEYYEKTASRLNATGADATSRWYSSLQVIGTPDQCVDKIAYIKELTGCEHFLAQFSYSGMGRDEVLRNLQLFNDKVQPRVKAM